MSTPQRDPRVGRPLTEVIERATLRSAAISANPHAATLERSVLDAFTERVFAGIIVTAISVSPRRGTVQLATRGPRGTTTMHLNTADIRTPA